MIALREQSRGVFSSFMFSNRRLPMPRLRRGCLETRHSSFQRVGWCENDSAEARGDMPVQSSGTISVNGVPLSTMGPFRTHLEILHEFSIFEVAHRTGAYQLPGELMIWFPIFRTTNPNWMNQFANGGSRIVETLNPTNPHAAAIGNGSMLSNYMRITFAKQGPLYYYVGVFQLTTTSGYVSVYDKIADSCDLVCHV